MIRQLISLTLLFTLAFGVFMGAANTPWVLTATVPSLSAARLDEMGLEMEDFRIGRQTLEGFKTLVLDDISFLLKHGETAYQVRIARIVFPDAKEFWSSEAPVQAGVGQLSVQAQGLDFSVAQGRLAVNRDEVGWMSAIEGMAQGVELTYQGYALHQGQGRFLWNPQQLQILDVVLGVGGGRCAGQMTLGYAPEESILVWAEISDVRLEDIALEGPSPFREAEGRAFGTARVSASRGYLEVLDIQFSLPQGGKIKGDLLKRFLAQIGPEQSASLPLGDTLWFDRAVVRLHGGTRKAPQLTYQIINRAYGLDVDQTVPLNPDGGWEALFLGPK